MPIKRLPGAARRGSVTTVLTLVAAASFLCGCANSELPDDASQVIRIGVGVGPTARAGGITVLTDLLYAEPLVWHDANGRPGPGLAESWTWDDGGRLLTLRLKRGVRFHDGSPLTSRVVAEILDRVRLGTNGRVPLGFEYVQGITASDETTVRVRLSRPDFFLLTELNELRIVHPEQRDIGTGPFRLVRRQPIVEARRFEHYHAGRPASEVVQIKTYETHRAAWAALMRGEADAAQEVSRESIEFMEKSTQLQTYSTLQPYYIPLVFNQRHPALRIPAVRKAIVHALDREAIIEDAMRGHGDVASNPIWPSHWAYEPETPARAYAPAQAAALLDGAGFPLRPSTDGSPRVRFSFRCLFWSEDPQYERIALMLQKQLFDIGVQVELEPVTLANLAKRAGSGDFDAFLARANAGRSLMFTYHFWRSPAGDRPAFWRTGYNGADAALDRLRASVSDGEIRNALQDIAARFREDAPAAFIAWTKVTRVLNADVQVGDPGVQDPFLTIWRWHRAPGASSQ